MVLLWPCAPRRNHCSASAFLVECIQRIVIPSDRYLNPSRIDTVPGELCNHIGSPDASKSPPSPCTCQAQEIALGSGMADQHPLGVANTSAKQHRGTCRGARTRQTADPLTAQCRSNSVIALRQPPRNVVAVIETNLTEPLWHHQFGTRRMFPNTVGTSTLPHKSMSLYLGRANNFAPDF